VKRILCWFGWHDFERVVLACGDYEEYGQGVFCSRCLKYRSGV
jgi:hypothetical protein